MWQLIKEVQKPDLTITIYLDERPYIKDHKYIIRFGTKADLKDYYATSQKEALAISRDTEIIKTLKYTLTKEEQEEYDAAMKADAWNDNRKNQKDYWDELDDRGEKRLERLQEERYSEFD